MQEINGNYKQGETIMYEILKQRLASAPASEDKINRVREFLQALMLKIMFDRGFFDNLAFVGGTALRVLYGMRRYSEDLDFSLIKKRGYAFKSMLRRLEYDLKHYNLKTEISSMESNVLHSGFVKFPQLLKELNLSAHKEQKLSIKLEVDTNPPLGWKVKLVTVADPFVFAVKTFDLPSLYAAKLHACFFRRYTKGRDFYDLIWYLGKKIEPNYVLLNNAIRQTEKKNLQITQHNFKQFMQDKLKEIDFKLISKDIERFLEDKNELKLFNSDIILGMM